MKVEIEIADENFNHCGGSIIFDTSIFLMIITFRKESFENTLKSLISEFLRKFHCHNHNESASKYHSRRVICASIHERIKSDRENKNVLAGE